MLLIICSASLKSANKVLLKNIQMFPQAKTLFSTHSASLNLEHEQVSMTQLHLVFISSFLHLLIFLISDKNIMTAEEKGIFPQVFLVMIFKFTFFNTKIQQVLYMCPNLSSSVFITFSASLGTLWKHTLAPVEGKRV